LGCATEKKESKTTTTPATTASKTPGATMSFGVRGNCGMCKKTIETAANSLPGVANANWNSTQKNMTVAIDTTKTNLLAVATAVAASGYDTELSKGNTEAYNSLPGCCKYDRDMAMNLKE
jgi:copper chaperone CopZ